MERLGRLALEFLDAADAGGGDATGAYEAITEPLERSYEAHRAALDRMSKGVIDADGDLDALYESAPWQEHQQLAAQALYYLNWLHYRGALFYGGAKRKALLEKAANGFGEFATATKAAPVVIESHLGRGLAYLELDHVDWAINDFEAVVQAKGASPDRVRKARLALAEAYVKAGRAADALRASQQAVAEATPADRPRAQLTRVRALAMAAASAPAAQKASYRSEATSLLAQLQAGGGPWGSRAAQIARAGLDNPRVWASGAKAPKPEPPPPSEWDVTRRLVAGGKYKEAIPRLERIVASTAGDDQPNQAEARYLLGIARFRTGDLAGSIKEFDAVLAAKNKSSYRDDAAYLRFKANEALYAADPTPERLPAYEQAITAFLAEFPSHKAAPEARFRLGEIRQRQERYADAMAEYARVAGDPAFELRAAFGTAQSAVKLLEAAPQASKPDPKLLAQATAALDRFWDQIRREDFSKFGDAPVNELMGQAALMRAYLAALGDPPDYQQAVAWLGGFEEKYPTLTSQRPQVSEAPARRVRAPRQARGRGGGSGEAGGRHARRRLPRRPRDALHHDRGARAGDRTSRRRRRGSARRLAPHRARARRQGSQPAVAAAAARDRRAPLRGSGTARSSPRALPCVARGAAGCDFRACRRGARARGAGKDRRGARALGRGVERPAGEGRLARGALPVGAALGRARRSGARVLGLEAGAGGDDRERLLRHAEEDSAAHARGVPVVAARRHHAYTGAPATTISRPGQVKRGFTIRRASMIAAAATM